MWVNNRNDDAVVEAPNGGKDVADLLNLDG